jgi:hypothetical protein
MTNSTPDYEKTGLIAAGVILGIFGQALYDLFSYFITSEYPSLFPPIAVFFGAILAVFIMLIAWFAGTRLVR